MKKVAIINFILSIFLLFSCKSKSLETRVSEELGIDLSNSKTISKSSDYGSFGDGYSLLIMDCSGKDVEQQIINNQDWQHFPLSTEVNTLVYNNYEKFSSTIPEIKNGYFILIDRQNWTDKNILERYSYNFSIGLYDTDHNMFYYCKLDT